MKNFLEKLRQQQSLSESEIAEIFSTIMSGLAAHGDILDFLNLMRAKGATITEITGAARTLQKFSLSVHSQHEKILDTCGTGGDKKGTFNISTVSALVVAAAGIAVAKHGNRSVSSSCGSADILEALGVKLLSDPKVLGRCLDEVGIAFLFAPVMHPAMRNVAPARKELGVETIFNVLGPLLNPARATHQIMGIYSRDLVEPIANVLKNLGLQRALVAHGSDGLDEITTVGVTYVSEWTGKNVDTYLIEPRELGIPQASPDSLLGGDLKKNVAIVRAILDNAKGPQQDIVVLNSAYALYVADKVKNPKDGVALAKEMLASGQARKKLEALIEFTNR